MDIKSISHVILSIIFVYFLNYVLQQDNTEPNVEVMPEMVHSIAYDAYSPNPHFKNNQTLQLPPKGTIALGFMPEFDVKNVDEILSPLKDDEIDLERGKFIYNNFCAVCHGYNGEGDGPVTKRGVPPPPSIKTDKVKLMSDGHLYDIISNGVGNMPPYNIQINRNDRWQVTHYLKMMK
jgi:mono/diheme cytochrome c family protein